MRPGRARYGVLRMLPSPASRAVAKGLRAAPSRIASVASIRRVSGKEDDGGAAGVRARAEASAGERQPSTAVSLIST